MEQVWAMQAIEARAQRAEALRWDDDDMRPPNVEDELVEEFLITEK